MCVKHHLPLTLFTSCPTPITSINKNKITTDEVKRKYTPDSQIKTSSAVQINYVAPVSIRMQCVFGSQSLDL